MALVEFEGNAYSYDQILNSVDGYRRFKGAQLSDAQYQELVNTVNAAYPDKTEEFEERINSVYHEEHPREVKEEVERFIPVSDLGTIVSEYEPPIYFKGKILFLLDLGDRFIVTSLLKYDSDYEPPVYGLYLCDLDGRILLSNTLNFEITSMVSTLCGLYTKGHHEYEDEEDFKQVYDSYTGLINPETLEFSELQHRSSLTAKDLKFEQQVVESPEHFLLTRDGKVSACPSLEKVLREPIVIKNVNWRQWHNVDISRLLTDGPVKGYVPEGTTVDFSIHSGPGLNGIMNIYRFMFHYMNKSFKKFNSIQ